MEQRKLIDVYQLSKIISLSAITLKKLARENKIPGVNLGGRKWLFNADSVIKAIEKAGETNE